MVLSVKIWLVHMNCRCLVLDSDQLCLGAEKGLELENRELYI
jgi:hypothetical protein